MTDSYKGQFLVAVPALRESNFSRTVVFLCEHGPAGALGLIVNRPSSILIHEALPEAPATIPRDDTLWEGGPVQQDSITILHDHAAIGGTAVSLGISFGGERSLLDALFTEAAAGESAPKFRLYSGYSGWGAGQLESEMRLGSWVVCPADIEHVFSLMPALTWSTILRGMGGKFALMALTPPDPWLN